GRIDGKLDAIHGDLGDKADREEVQKVDEKVNKAHKKINIMTGAWAVVTAMFGGLFGLSGDG
ncbi:MAG: hypothetical protein ACE5KG_01760, partial [Nitrososphaerales archaeon]